MSSEATGASSHDLRMQARCLELSRAATEAGENPFACVICEGETIVAEATTRARRDGDITRHAELIAMSEAQQQLGRTDLSRCTIYSTVEPCAMCSYCIRETGIGRVVFSLSSPVMGGASKWDILGDTEISTVLPEVFRQPPEIVVGLLAEEAERIWRGWHPIDWLVLRHRNAIAPAAAQADEPASAPLPQRRSLWSRLWSAFGGG